MISPNSSSIDILMPCAIFDYIGAFLRSGFAHVDNVFPVIKTITWLLLPHRNSPEPEPCLRNLHQHAPELFGTFRNFPEPTTSGTYASIHRNPPKSSGTFRELAWNLHHFTPELSGTFRNLPPEPAPATRTGTHRSLSGLKTPLANAVGELEIFKKTCYRISSHLEKVSFLVTRCKVARHSGGISMAHA